MKDHHEFDREYIGESDYCTLILAGCGKGGIVSTTLHFGEDGYYGAYIVDETAEIPDHYEQEAEFSHWMKVYDDQMMVHEYVGGKITVYRAGELGCIIKIENF